MPRAMPLVLVVLTVGIIALLAMHCAAAPAGGGGTTRWEYAEMGVTGVRNAVFYTGTSTEELGPKIDALNTVGSRGWQLVSTVLNEDQFFFYFMRPAK